MGRRKMDDIKPPLIYEFRMKKSLPASLPMADLAQFLEQLAIVYGEPDHVHLRAVRKGSVKVFASVDPQAAEAVSQRIRTRGGSSTFRDETFERAVKRIDRLLYDRGDSGFIREHRSSGAELIYLPGIKAPLQQQVTVHENGTLDGRIIRVGGKPPTIPVHIQSDSGEIYLCTSTVEMARKLAPHLYGGEVRVFGGGKWTREEDGRWVVTDFKINDFSVLGDTSLMDTIESMRQIEGSGWNKMDDPHAELKRIRNG